MTSCLRELAGGGQVMCSPPGLPSPSRYVGWGRALTWQPRLSPGQGTSMGTHGGQTPREDKHPQKGQEAPQENKTGSRWTGGLEISNGVARGWRRRPKRLVGAGGDLVSLWGKVSGQCQQRGCHQSSPTQELRADWKHVLTVQQGPLPGRVVSCTWWL